MPGVMSGERGGGAVARALKPSRAPARGPVRVVAEGLGLDVGLGDDRSRFVCVDVFNMGRVERGARTCKGVDAFDAFALRDSALADESFEELEASTGPARGRPRRGPACHQPPSPSATPPTASGEADALLDADAEGSREAARDAFASARALLTGGGGTGESSWWSSAYRRRRT